MSTLPEFAFEERTAAKHVTVYSVVQLLTIITLILPFTLGEALIFDCMLAVRWICIIVSASQALCSLVGLFGKSFTPSYHRQTLWRRIMYKKTFVWQGFGILLISILIFFEVSVLFGAPFTQLMEETLHLSVLLTVLATFPGCLAWGVRPHIWAKVLLGSGPETTYERAVMHVGMFSVLGAWLGAFPIPLDWDRPWQIWPVSCSVGALFGCIAGNTYNLVYYYRRMRQRKRKRM